MDGLLSDLSLDVSRPAPSAMQSLFPRPVREIWLEIGFGGGEHLLHQASLHPDIGFIGVEPFVNGMAKALAGIAQGGQDNIRLYHDDALHVLNWLPDSCLSRVYLLYPDPWPKKRHWKRRFVSQSTLDQFARTLRPDGEFRFASDIDTYVDWTLRHCHASGRFRWTADQASDWHAPWADWIRTRYEAKAIREGRTPAYLTFSKQAD